MSGFAEFRNRVWIRATLEMQTALAVGSRLSLDPVGTDMPVMKDPQGNPFIPGSSIKGVVRFQVERVLRAVNQRPHLWACDPFGSPCVTPEQKTQFWEACDGDDGCFAQRVFAASCTACRLFGSPWFAGRVAFKDAYLVNGDLLLVKTQIRDGVGIDRDLGAARTGVKYDFETVVPGAQFGIEIVAENVEPWELGLLLTVLRLWEEGGIALGGKSTRGPGWGVLKDIRIEQVTADQLLDYLTTGSRAVRERDEFIRAFQRQWQAWQEGDHA